MTLLRRTLAPYVESGALPGLVALVARGNDIERLALGSRSVGGEVMTVDSVFRIASSSKPITAVATLILVDDGVLGLDQPVADLLPELAHPVVLRDPAGSIDDVVAAERPITVRDLLTFTAGHGFPGTFDHPVVARLVDELGQGPPRPQEGIESDEWMRILGTIPLMHQPGAGWTYNTGADILGVLLARASGRSLADLLHDRVFGPLGMSDTGFSTRPDQIGRLTSLYRRNPETGSLTEVDGSDGQWSTPPVFASGAGGLVSTAADWLAFGRMLLDGGAAPDGRRILSPALVGDLLTDHTTPALRASGGMFLDGQGWGYGGSVDVDLVEPWHVAGRYGWVGGSGTVTYVVPTTDTVTILLTQVEVGDPTSGRMINDFLRTATAPGKCR